ncbi:MAG: hypothetical protein H6818_18040 [Phycisphaerales bacterium]|nr:hypothetical protein [Phycisphaerales bacterium]
MAGTMRTSRKARSSGQIVNRLKATVLLAPCLTLAACHQVNRTSTQAPEAAAVEHHDTLTPNATSGEPDRQPEHRSATTHTMSEVRRLSIPVVNTGRFVDQPLSDQQIREILAEAESITPKGSRVWFIRAMRNQIHDDKPTIAVTIYFTPDRRTDRIRYGSCFTIDTAWEDTRKALIEATKYDTNKPPIEHRLSTYCQVSTAESPFNGSLDIPKGSLLPFPSQDELTEAELIEIIDFVRAEPSMPEASKTSIPDNKVDSNAPIAFIRKTVEGYDIHMGSLEGPLSGMGQLIQCTKAVDGLKLTALGSWVS